MIYEPIDIILHYLILFILILELVIWNLNGKKGHMDFWETCGIVHHHV